MQVSNLMHVAAFLQRRLLDRIFIGKLLAASRRLDFIGYWKFIAFAFVTWKKQWFAAAQLEREPRQWTRRTSYGQLHERVATKQPNSSDAPASSLSIAHRCRTVAYSSVQKAGFPTAYDDREVKWFIRPHEKSHERQPGCCIGIDLIRFLWFIIVSLLDALSNALRLTSCQRSNKSVQCI